MLALRLARTGRKNAPFFRIVLTEHTKPVQTGYKEVLGWYNPLNHKMEVNAERVVALIANGAQPSERLGKLLYAHTKNELFKKFFVIKDLQRKPKKDK
ncbi:MAG: 30S ribosomal protein S16 [bacterium]